MIEGGIVLLDVRSVVGEDGGAAAQAFHQLYAHLLIKGWRYIEVTESQLVLNHLYGDVVLVGKGGHCAEHLTCRNRIRRVFT